MILEKFVSGTALFGSENIVPDTIFVIRVMLKCRIGVKHKRISVKPNSVCSTLSSITQGSSIVNFTYNAASVTTQVRLPNGITMDYAFDNAWQLTGITYKNSSGTTLGNLTYSNDTVGRRTNIAGTYARTNLPTALTANAVYDNNNRLTSWNGTAITYDNNGNMLSDGSRTFTWDARDRLTSISGGATASFTYDALGRRTSKTVSGTTTKFVYDGLNPVQERNSSNAVTANLLTGGLDQYFSRTVGATQRVFMTDALGSTVALTDSSQAVQTSYTYEPFGRTTQTGAADTSSFKYTGREDDGTGLYYYRARYYNPVLQRFVSEDPIGLSGGINAYSYAINNPLSYVDPTGKLIWILVGALVGEVSNIAGQLIQNGGHWDQIDPWQVVVATGAGGAAGGFGAWSSQLNAIYQPVANGLAGATINAAQAALTGQNVSQNAFLGGTLGFSGTIVGNQLSRLIPYNTLNFVIPPKIGSSGVIAANAASNIIGNLGNLPIFSLFPCLNPR